MARVSRRRLLGLGISGGLLLGVGGGALAWLSAGYRLRDGEAAIGLSTKQLSVARALVDALVPGQGALPNGVELSIHQRMDEEAWAAEPSIRSDISAVLELLEHVPPLYGNLGRFSSLDRQARQQVFAALLGSRVDLLAQAAAALQQMVHMFYYAHPRTWSAIEYDGPRVPEARPPASARRYAQLLREHTGGTA